MEQCSDLDDACAITAKKAEVKVAHVEAGIRSGDLSMPEEINRIATDALTDFFTTSETPNAELRRCGIGAERIFFAGNTMIDTLLKQRANFTPPPCWEELGLKESQYLVLTLHRPANVDEEAKLKSMIGAIVVGSQGASVVFPVHPRTAGIFQQAGIGADNLCLVDPLPYLEFNHLVSKARGVITEETTVMGVPCMTLRDSTERPETIETGTNDLVGTEPANQAPYLTRLFSGEWEEREIPEKWDGRDGERIVQVLAKEFG